MKLSFQPKDVFITLWPRYTGDACFPKSIYCSVKIDFGHSSCLRTFQLSVSMLKHCVQQTLSWNP